MNSSALTGKVRQPGLLLLLLFSLFICGAASAAEEATAAAEPAEVRLTREILKAYERQDWDAVAAMFAEDGRLHSVMRDPFIGREVVRQRLIDFHHGLGMEDLDLEIIHIAKVDDVVIVERLDKWRQNGTDRAVPAVGVLSFENGLVKVWREYYDLETMKKQMAP